MTHDHDTPSRGAQKRADQALQELGEGLVKLKAEELARIPLPDDLAAAVAEARRIHERGGHKRQLQYIGKLMRRIDAAPIAQALAAVDAGRQHDADAFHHLEAWRDRLLREGAAAIAALQEERPELNAARLATVLQQAQHDQARGNAHGPRDLFRYLRDEVFAKTPV